MLKNLLFLSIFVMILSGVSNHSYGCHKDKRHGPNGDTCDDTGPPPEPDPAACEIDFCIDFASDNKVTGDGEEYCHGEEKVLVFTAKGPGFHFDTTRSGKGQSTDRFVKIDLVNFKANSPPPYVPSIPTEGIKVDLRFDKSGNPSGLDLCSLSLEVPTKKVPLAITFEVDGAVDNSNTLTYGAPAGSNGCGVLAEVTLKTIGPRTWEITGTNACLWDGAMDALLFKGERNRVIIDGGTGDAGKLTSFTATLTEILP